MRYQGFFHFMRTIFFVQLIQHALVSNYVVNNIDPAKQTMYDCPSETYGIFTIK